MKKIKPWQWILFAMLAAFLVGGLVNAFLVGDRTAVPTVFSPAGNILIGIFDYIGTLFLKLLKMLIIPLVFSSIVVGIAGLGKTEGFARLGGKTVAYYAMTSLFAILIGLTVVNVIKPGMKDGKPNQAIKEQFEANEEAYTKEITEKVGDHGKNMGTVLDIFLRMVPENIFESFGANNKMLSLIFVALLTGIGLIFVSGPSHDAVLGFIRGINELTLLITNWVMMLAPIGVFGLVAETTAKTGFSIVLLLGQYFCVVLAALLIHLLVVMPLVLKYIGGISPRKHFYAMRNALLTAFSTSSSAATLPVTMRALRENAGASERVTSFVLPLGATVNMDGTALYECVAVMFAAQVLGWEMTLTGQFTVVVLALLTSIGVAAVPSASLVAIIIIVNNIGIPNAEAVIGLLLAVDRPLDMARTAVNVFSDSCGAVIIAKSESEPIYEEDFSEA